MDYQSPGNAATTAFQTQMLQEAALRRQASLDALNTRKVESEIELGHAALAEKRTEAAERVREKERAETERDVAGMAPGDIPDSDLVARAAKHHIPLRTTAAEAPEGLAPPASIAAPGAPTQNPADVTPEGTGVLAVPPRGSIRYAGSPKQAEAAATKKKIDGIIQQISGLDPTSPQFKQLATQYEMEAGKSLPAAFMNVKPAAEEGEAVMRQHPKTGQVQRMVDGQWVDWTHDVPLKAHWMTVPDTSAADAARIAAGANQLQTIKEHAYAELSKWAAPIQGHLDAVKDLGMTLNARTPEADKLVAPLVIKATISGQASGFRMTRSEIENVTNGRSRWESLRAALQQWSTNPAEALSLTDTQRDDLRSLTRKIRDKATKLSRQITDARHQIDDASDVKTVNSARTSLQEQLAAMDDADTGEADTSPTRGMSPADRVKYFNNPNYKPGGRGSKP